MDLGGGFASREEGWQHLVPLLRRHDTYTDIITFDYVAADLISGDIFICIDRVGENASKFGVAFEEELHRVIIHGVLHLLGQGDKSESEAAEMRRQEEESLSLWNDMFHVERKC